MSGTSSWKTFHAPSRSFSSTASSNSRADLRGAMFAHTETHPSAPTMNDS